MKLSCPSCGHEFPVDSHTCEGPAVRRHPASDRVGSCNFCDRYTELMPPGVRPHPVTEIRSQSRGPQLTVRICDECLTAVKRATPKVRAR